MHQGTPQIQDAKALTRPSIPDEEYATEAQGVACKPGWYYWVEFYAEWFYTSWSKPHFNRANAIGLC